MTTRAKCIVGEKARDRMDHVPFVLLSTTDSIYFRLFLAKFTHLLRYYLQRNAVCLKLFGVFDEDFINCDFPFK